MTPRHTAKMLVLVLLGLTCVGLAHASSLIVSNYGITGPIITVSIQHQWVQSWSGTDNIAGFAHEQNSNTVYMNDAFNRSLLKRVVGDLNTDSGAAITDFGDSSANYLDMAWADAIWAADSFQNKLDQINPSDGTVVSSIPLAFQPTGLAFDGTDFWVSENTDDGNGGFLTNNLWKVSMDGATATWMRTPTYAVGGLAYEAGTVFVGSSDGIIQALDAVTLLDGTTYTTDGSRFVQGLEVLNNFETVPEPGTMLLFGGALLAIGWLRRKAA